MSTITSANITFSLGVTGVFPVPQTLQAWSADDAFTVEAVKRAETQMGVDGFFTAGRIFESYKMDLNFLANSASVPLFYAWDAYEQAINDKAYAFGTIIMPSVNMMFILSQGVLQSLPVMPPAKKVLQPVKTMIEWGKITYAPI